jgi:hypothetical protein
MIRLLQQVPLLIVAVFIGVCAHGCGKSAPTTAVSGQVLLGGKPLAEDGVTIFFWSKATQNTVQETVDAQGKFSIPAVELGQHIVWLAAQEPKPLTDPAVAQTQQLTVDPATGQEIPTNVDPSGPTTQIPGKYLSSSTTPLTADIKEGGQATPLSFDLEP